MKHSINMKNNLVADDDENEEDDIEIIKQQKKHTKSSKTKRTSKSATKEITTASFPEYKDVKPEDEGMAELDNMGELDKIREMTLKGMLKFTNQPEHPQFQALKKIFDICNKGVEQKQENQQGA